MRIRGATLSDISAVADLVEEGFDLLPGMGSAYAGVYRDLMAGDPGLTPEDSRVAIMDGEIAGHALVIPRQMGVGGLEVPAGVVAFVVVRPEDRGRGIGRALMQDAESWMRSKGQVMSHLAGDPGFYRRFGYVEAYGRCLGQVAADRLTGYRGSTLVRDARVEDAGVLRALSDAEHTGLSGHLRRDASQWAWQIQFGHPGRYTARNPGLAGFLSEEKIWVAEKEGRVQGYLRALVGSGRALVHEGAAGDEETASALASRAGEKAEGIGATKVEMLLPPAGSLGRWMAARGTGSEERLDPEALANVIDARDLLVRLEGVLTERVRGSALRGRSTGLLIETEGDRLGIRVTPEGVWIGESGEEAEWRVSLPAIGLTQMLLGGRDYASILGGRPERGKRLAEWISVLFPEQPTWICLADRF